MRMTDAIRQRAGLDECGCWAWNGARSSSGYGLIRQDGRMYLAHVLFYNALVGPVPGGLELDHTCRNTLCVNPAHLEPVTHRTNVLRGRGPTAINAAKTHCINGHEFTPENTYIQQGRRQCRSCNRAAVAAYRGRRSAA